MPKTTEVSVTPVESTTKFFSIAKIWLNNGEGDSGRMAIRANTNLPPEGLLVRIFPGADLAVFDNEQRDGKKDAEKSIAIRVEKEVFDGLVAAQEARKNAPQA
jgi:hypothetical protein